MSFYVNVNMNQLSNPYEIANTFCESYYSTISTKGHAGILNLFDPSCHCNYNGIEILGMYIVLKLIAEYGIIKLNYSNIFCTPMIIDNETLLIQTTGLCQYVSFLGDIGYQYQFTETFILKCTQGRAVGVGHIFKLIY